MNATDDIDTV